MSIEPVLSETYFGSTIPQYLLFFAVLALGALLGRSLSFLYERHLKRKAEATETEVDDILLHALGGPVVLLGVVLAVAAGRRFLAPEGPVETLVEASVTIPVVVALAWIAVRLTDGLIETYVVEYADRTESKLDDELVPILSRVTNIAIVSIAGIVVMDSVGYDVTAIIASLGVGGLAVAFAARKTTADVFGGAHILSTNPFLVDDVVEIDGTTGTVEEIGLRTTRIRDFDGRRVTIPNSTIANAEVVNVSSEPSRRVTTFLGLPYRTSASEMDRALELAGETAGAVEGVDSEQTEALFWEYGESSLRVRLRYHVEALEEWQQVKADVNRELQRAFEEADLSLAVPTRRIRVDQAPDETTAPTLSR